MSDPSKLIHVVIIGGASTYRDVGKLPTIEDVEDGSAIVEPYGYKMQIFIADTNLNYAIRLAKGESSLKTPPIVEDARMIIGTSDSKRVVVGDIPAWQIPSDIKNSKESVIYISYIPNISSSYEIMSLVGSYIRENRWFIPVNEVSEKISITKLMTDFISIQGGKTDSLSYLLPNFIYALYQGENIGAGMYYIGDMVSAKTQIILGCEVLRQYITAGYIESDNRASVDGWCLNVETPIIKGIIHTYGLIPAVEDRTTHMEIRTNASYRQQLTELLSRVISNFAINNKVITLEEARLCGEWYSTKTYTLIMNKLSDSLFALHVVPKPFNKASNFPVDAQSKLVIRSSEADVISSLPVASQLISSQPLSLDSATSLGSGTAKLPIPSLDPQLSVTEPSSQLITLGSTSQVSALGSV